MSTTAPACSSSRMERYIRRIAGTFIMVTVVLSQVHHPNWIYFTAFVGLNLFQYSFTNFCPMEIILRKGFKVTN